MIAVILGASGKTHNFVDTYFELDADGSSAVEFKSVDQLRQQAASEGVMLNLRPFDSVYREFRFTWFDYAAAAILIFVPAAGFLLLIVWIWRVRRRGQIAALVQ